MSSSASCTTSVWVPASLCTFSQQGHTFFIHYIFPVIWLLLQFRFLKNDAACFSDSLMLGWWLMLTWRGVSPLKHLRNSITSQTSSVLDKNAVLEMPGTNLCCVFYFKMFSDICSDGMNPTFFTETWETLRKTPYRHFHSDILALCRAARNDSCA